MMLEQGPGAPAIERPDRGDPRRHAIEVPAEMIEDPRGNELNRVEGTAGHLEEPDLEGERQPVQGSRRSRTEASSPSSRVKKCSISSADSVAETRPHRGIDVPTDSSDPSSSAGDRIRNRCVPLIRVSPPARRPSSILPFPTIHKRSSAQRKPETSRNKGL